MTKRKIQRRCGHWLPNGYSRTDTIWNKAFDKCRCVYRPGIRSGGDVILASMLRYQRHLFPIGGD